MFVEQDEEEEQERVCMYIYTATLRYDCVSLFYVNDIRSAGSRGRTWGVLVYTFGRNSVTVCGVSRRLH